MTTTCETPNGLVAETHYFLASLFEPEDVIEFRCKNEDTQQVEQRFWWLLREVDFETLMSVNERRRHVWFGVNPRSRRGGATASDVPQCRSVCLDLDGVSPADGLGRIQQAGLPPPTLAISSGGGSQFFWRLSRAIDPSQWRRKQHALIRLVRGADPAIHDLPRVMRLPGFRNWKVQYSPIFPRARLFHEGTSS
jgi:hypothetical protein